MGDWRSVLRTLVESLEPVMSEARKYPRSFQFCEQKKRNPYLIQAGFSYFSVTLNQELVYSGNFQQGSSFQTPESIPKQRLEW